MKGRRWLLPAVVALGIAVPSLSSADPAPVNLVRGAVGSATSAENAGLLETAVAAAASSYSLPEKDGQISVPVRLNRASDSGATR
jgi:hypothetical protein